MAEHGIYTHSVFCLCKWISKMLPLMKHEIHQTMPAKLRGGWRINAPSFG